MSVISERDGLRWLDGNGGRPEEHRGLLLVVMVTSASVQDRDGARPAPAHLRDLFASISPVRADGGCAGGYPFLTLVPAEPFHRAP
ncbi:hypothetical protein [Streptomyces mirabilis]|uniref:hypothetical protein n=1 Tax=Streptomyces mirabilis TaxID=68239 RepID=UPI0033BC0AEE